MSDSTTTYTVSARGKRRVRRHLLIGLSATAVTSLFIAVRGTLTRESLSVATAYVALGLLATTLALGPLNVLRGRPNPVSFDRRRDFGVWSAIFGLAHTAIGLTVHLRGRMPLYFLAPAGEPNLLGLRLDPFGGANDFGLVGAMLFLALAVISNDLSLRTLGTSRWRAVQRWAYVLFAATALHGALYQVIEKQRLILVALFASVIVTVIALQLAGRRRFRRRSVPH